MSQTSDENTASPSTQRELFQWGAGDEWLRRNRPDLGKGPEVVGDVIEAMGLKPKALLEVGCSNGWRLKKLKERFGCVVLGIDPSVKAIEEARIGEKPGQREYLVATANRIPLEDNQCDVVLMGFCLCFIAPEDWAATVYEADRVLRDGGHLIIYDHIICRPTRVPVDGALVNGVQHVVYIYNNNWAELWLGNPVYTLVYEKIDRQEASSVVVLKKDIAGVFRFENGPLK